MLPYSPPSGIVPNVVRELFDEIAKTQVQQQSSGAPYFRQYSLRLSMMEIYNEVGSILFVWDGCYGC